MRTIVIASLLLGPLVFAHGPGHSHSGHGHGHGHSKPAGQSPNELKNAVSSKKARKLAAEQVDRLIRLKKINDSWKKPKFENAEKKQFGRNHEWVVTFKNDKGEIGKKTLYIFLKLNGEFVAANFTGR